MDCTLYCGLDETFKFPGDIYLINVDSVIMVPHSPDHKKSENLMSATDLWTGTLAGNGT